MNPEDNNNKTAPTTVGGVTFGGGLNNSATPAENTPQPQQNNVAAQPAPAADPIMESTGEEFDSIMNSAVEKTDNAPAPENTPAPNNAPSAPAPSSIPDLNQAPIPSNLSVPVTSPTHFDTQNTVRPIVKDPGIPMINNDVPASNNMKAPKSPADPEKQIKKFSVISVIFGILSTIFMVAAIAAVVLYLQRESSYRDMEKRVAKADAIVKAIEETTGVSPINSVEDIPVYKATTGYIYISEWNIKIKIPSDLDNVSYILNNNRYHPSICFNAVQKNIQYFPDFANVALNPGRMGCLTRIPVAEGSFDAATGISFGTQVFTYKDYNYFYTGPIDYSKDEANLGLEHTTDQIIKNMLSANNISAYE